MTQTLPFRLRPSAAERRADRLTDEQVCELVELIDEPLTPETLRHAAHNGVPVYSPAVGMVTILECPGVVTGPDDYIGAISSRYGYVEVIFGNLRVGPALAWRVFLDSHLEYELDVLTYR